MPSQYSQMDKRRAAIALRTSGTAKGAARLCRVPYSTLKHWKNHDEEFQGFYAELKAEHAEKFSARYAQVIDLSIEAAIDRLTNGDTVFHPKTGDLTQRPLTGRDAALIGAIAQDKLRALEGMPNQIIEHRRSPDELVAMLTKMSKELPRRANDAIDAEVVKPLLPKNASA